MNFKTAIFAAAAASMFSIGACALEPVEPQPAVPLTFSDPAYHKITPETAKKMMETEKVVVIDVREASEFAAGHVKGAVNVPLSTMKPGMKLEAAPDVNAKILVQCKSGVRAEKASKMLVEAGYKNVYNFYGVSQWPYDLVK